MQAEGEIVQLPTERVAPPKDFRMFFEESTGVYSRRSTS